MQGLKRIEDKMANAFGMPLMTVNRGGLRELVLSAEQEKCVEVAGILAEILFNAKGLPVSVYELLSDEFFQLNNKLNQESLFRLANSSFFIDFLQQHFTEKEIYSEGSRISEAVLNLGLLKFLSLFQHDTTSEADESLLITEVRTWLTQKQLEA